MSNGVLVIDSSVLRSLQSAEAQADFGMWRKRTGVALRISAIPLLEVLQTPNHRIRSQLLEILSWLVGEDVVLPGPERLLRFAASAALEGVDAFIVPQSGLEWILREPHRINGSHIEQARYLIQRQHAVWEAAHQRGRRELRRMIVKNHSKDPWGSVQRFLDEQWTRKELLDGFFSAMWSELGLPGLAPVEHLMQVETWRLHFEAEGALIYQRAIADQTTKRVQITDVKQLIYLAGAEKRMLLTCDQPFAGLARGVLDDRYPGASVVVPAGGNLSTDLSQAISG